MLHPAPVHFFRRTTLWVVMFALVLAQSWGLLHRVVHAPQSERASVGAPGAPFASISAPVMAERHDEGAAPGLTWLERLFASHDRAACDSLDHIAHGDFLLGPPADICVAAVSQAVQVPNPAWQLAAQAAGYLARGPPLQA
jgi:hypothetical protein